jgi:uncharacterized flavoprotein (TIGR03862 family)
MPSIAIIGGGPAGLMAAEAARAAGAQVDLYERKGSVGRKFLLAGKGGLNLTHAEPHADFVNRFRERAPEVGQWLGEFDAAALRAWARGLGVETFVGSSGRVFPADLKAAPLLRGWVRRLRAQGVRLHVHHRLVRIDPAARGFTLRFEHGPAATCDAVVLALGGGSWPELGSDGAWFGLVRALGVEPRALRPSNGGFECAWSTHFRERFAGEPVKPVVLRWTDRAGRLEARQGEFVVTAHGVEGGLVYAASADLRDAIEHDGHADVALDLAPGLPPDALSRALGRARGKRSIGEHLRRAIQLDGVRAGLLFECARSKPWSDPVALAAQLKALPLRLLAPRPLAEAISSAGGVRLEDLDADLMLRSHAGLYFAGEMLDWEAPTGGYLLTACFASGRRAGAAAARWAMNNLAP